MKLIRLLNHAECQAEAEQIMRDMKEQTFGLCEQIDLAVKFLQPQTTSINNDLD